MVRSLLSHLLKSLVLRYFKHWYAEKVRQDAEIQGVEEKRVAILLKSKNRKNYVYFEEKLLEYGEKDLKWDWTDENKRGPTGETH